MTDCAVVCECDESSLEYRAKLTREVKFTTTSGSLRAWMDLGRQMRGGHDDMVVVSMTFGIKKFREIYGWDAKNERTNDHT